LFGRKHTTSPYIDYEPSAALRHKEGSQVLLDGWGDFGSQYNSGRDIDAVSEDDLPPLEEILRPTLRKEVLIDEPEKSKHALPRASQQAWTRLMDVDDSQGKCIVSTSADQAASNHLQRDHLFLKMTTMQIAPTLRSLPAI